MNTNLIHNILNLIGLIVGALLTVDWTVFGMSATTAAQIAAGVLLLITFADALRRLIGFVVLGR